MNSGRSITQEGLERAPAAEIPWILDDLRRINRWLGGNISARTAFATLVPGARFTVLDVGAASSGSEGAIRQAWPGATVISLDILQSHLPGARAGRGVVADAFRLPFAPQSIDYVYCSLFLHHFSNEQVVSLLTGFANVARLGVVVVDLERNAIARQFLPATRWLFGWHPTTVEDAKLSVKAGFTLPELRRLAAEAGLQDAVVARHIPWFRLSIAWARRPA